MSCGCLLHGLMLNANPKLTAYQDTCCIVVERWRGKLMVIKIRVFDKSWQSGWSLCFLQRLLLRSMICY